MEIYNINRISFEKTGNFSFPVAQKFINLLQAFHD